MREERDFCFYILQERQNERYRFGPLIDELFQCKNFSYVTTLTVLVNCMLAGCDSVEERVRLRNELLGKKNNQCFYLYHNAANNNTTVLYSTVLYVYIIIVTFVLNDY